MVVRPALAGMMRRPYPAKKMALMSSDLPRENSATKATITWSLRTCDSSRCSCSSMAASMSSWSASQVDKARNCCAKPRRHTPC